MYGKTGRCSFQPATQGPSQPWHGQAGAFRHARRQATRTRSESESRDFRDRQRNTPGGRRARPSDPLTATAAARRAARR